MKDWELFQVFLRGLEPELMCVERVDSADSQCHYFSFRKNGKNIYISYCDDEDDKVIISRFEGEKHMTGWSGNEPDSKIFLKSIVS